VTNLVTADVDTVRHDDCNSHSFSSDGHEFGRRHGLLASSGLPTGPGAFDQKNWIYYITKCTKWYTTLRKTFKVTDTLNLISGLHRFTSVTEDRHKNLITVRERPQTAQINGPLFAHPWCSLYFRLDH